MTKVNLPPRISHLDDNIAIQAALEAGNKLNETLIPNHSNSKQEQFSKRTSIKSTAYTEASKFLFNSQSIHASDQRNSRNNQAN